MIMAKIMSWVLQALESCRHCGATKKDGRDLPKLWEELTDVRARGVQPVRGHQEDRHDVLALRELTS